MAIQPKTEPGSPLRSFSTTHKRNYNEMSISELVSVLRVAIQIKDFDEVEEELMNREAKLKAEIGLLRERIEMERLKSIEAEEGLKIIEKQCEKGKRAQENYEQLLKEVKKYNLVEKNTIEELRKKNDALEREVCELKEFKQKRLDDRKCVAGLWTKIRVLEQQKVGDKSALDALNRKNIELEEAVKKNLTVIERLRTENGKLTIEELRKKNVALEREVCELKEFKQKRLGDGKCLAELWTKIRVLEQQKVGDKSALDALNTKNIELEKAVKKNLTVIEGLRTENGKLTDEKHERETLFKSLERKYSELRVSVVKLEDDVKLLMSEDASDCGNTKVEPNPAVSFAVKDEEDVGDYELEDDTGEYVPLQRNEGVKLNLEKVIIDLVDDDDDDDDDDDAVCTSQGLHGKKTISPITAENERSQRVETIKRKRASDIQTSMSTSIPLSDLFERDEPHVKRSKTSPARSDI